MQQRPIKTLFLPQKGSEEPWLGDVAEALAGFAELGVFDPGRDLTCRKNACSP